MTGVSNQEAMCQESVQAFSFGRDFLPFHKKELFKRIPSDNWNKILSSMKEFVKEVDFLTLEAFKNGDWSHFIFQDEHFLYHALHAHLHEQIDEEQFIRVCLYDACLRQNAGQNPASLKTYRLFDSSGEIDMVASRSLRAASMSFLNADEFRCFIEKLRALPSYSTSFFSVARTNASGIESQSHRFCDDELYRMITYAPLGLTGTISSFLTIGNQQLVLPPVLLYELFCARCGDHAITINPVIGYRPWEKLSDPSQRVIFIPCSLHSSSTREGQGLYSARTDEYNSVENVHRKDCSPLTVYHHDIYHLQIDSCNVHRSLWVDFAQYCGLHKKFPEKIEILDREFKIYTERNFSDSCKFWMSLANWICKPQLQSDKEAYEGRLNLSKQFISDKRDRFAQYSGLLEGVSGIERELKSNRIGTGISNEVFQVLKKVF
ncbi:MAG: hypothetical protein CMO81_02160 [Waddliaceae bacterium]|nr:hypothetical protein [Waddliaceae bacterium]